MHRIIGHSPQRFIPKINQGIRALQTRNFSSDFKTPRSSDESKFGLADVAQCVVNGLFVGVVGGRLFDAMLDKIDSPKVPPTQKESIKKETP